MRKSVFYFTIAGLVVLNGFLLSKPNLLGKIGLFIYHYDYLRTFPRTLLTASMVVGTAIVVGELITLLVRHGRLNRTLAGIVLAVLIAGSFALLVKTGLDFSTWTYSHTGLRFRLGAFMLPTLVIGIFTFALLRVPAKSTIFPDSASLKGDQSDGDIQER